jgi:hypothetical protein
MQDAGTLREEAVTWLKKHNMKVKQAKNFMEFRQIITDIRRLTNIPTHQIFEDLKKDLLA